MSYFFVFESKCFVLNKKPKSSKFAPKVYEYFLLGYDSNSHSYHVFNKDLDCGYDSNSSVYHIFNKGPDCVEIMCDAVFHETNDSQVEQYDLDIIDD
jgi:hypothetical protein